MILQSLEIAILRSFFFFFWKFLFQPNLKIEGVVRYFEFKFYHFFIDFNFIIASSFNFQIRPYEHAINFVCLSELYNLAKLFIRDGLTKMNKKSQLENRLYARGYSKVSPTFFFQSKIGYPRRVVFSFVRHRSRAASL